MLPPMNVPYQKYRCCLRGSGWIQYSKQMDLRKQEGVPVLISRKIDFKPQVMRRDKESHLILIKGTIYERDIMTLNIHARNSCLKFHKANTIRYKVTE